MVRPDSIELGDGSLLPILFEDRSVLAVDKPAGWMLVPFNWQRTRWNLQAAIESSIASGAYWARRRGLRFLRNVHRLDAETSGVLLFAKSRGALESLGDLFESREVEKQYLAVAAGTPSSMNWFCREPLGPDPQVIGRMLVDPENGKPAETQFQVLGYRDDPRLGPLCLIEARPFSGRTHQIRIHLATAGCPVIGDPLYGQPAGAGLGMGLRSARLTYLDPFTRRRIDIRAPVDEFQRQFGFTPGVTISELPKPSSRPKAPLPPPLPVVRKPSPVQQHPAASRPLPPHEPQPATGLPNFRDRPRESKDPRRRRGAAGFRKSTGRPRGV
ncbi:MAG: RluA family pseudouridine synthase [Limisphaerales bacterium]